MSRIGKKPVAIPSGVTVELTEQDVRVKGPKGALALTLVPEVSATLGDQGVTVIPRDETKRARSMWGMQRTRVANMVAGVHEGFTKVLLLTGVGYRAIMKGKSLTLQLGYSHDIDYPLPEGIEVVCPSATEIRISGIDKQKVGQVAAEIRSFRPPEPFKGKGVRYADEYIFRKEGKKK